MFHVKHLRLYLLYFHEQILHREIKFLAHEMKKTLQKPIKCGIIFIGKPVLKPIRKGERK